jgi:hypothetical protein
MLTIYFILFIVYAPVVDVQCAMCWNDAAAYAGKKLHQVELSLPWLCDVAKVATIMLLNWHFLMQITV